jgi:hypothetical protein
VTLLVPAMTPDESGAIGAACEVPETAAATMVAIAIAKTVRIIVVLLRRDQCKHKTRKHDGRFAIKHRQRRCGDETLNLRLSSR